MVPQTGTASAGTSPHRSASQEFNALREFRCNSNQIFRAFDSSNLKIGVKYNSNKNKNQIQFYFNLILVLFYYILVFTVVFGEP
jgi:hypothetical protein